MKGLGTLAAGVLAGAALAQCSGHATSRPHRVSAGPPVASGAAVLFIGNSLTGANDLPRRVQELARDGGAPIEVDAVIAAGFSLEDHLSTGRALSRIRSRRWRAVILQQGPSTLPASRANLIQHAHLLARRVREGGARPALLMVWGLPGQRQEDVSASYRAAAGATGSLLIPAGDAWQAALARDRSLPLTARDRFHPSPLGTWLAALAVHCALNGALPPAPPLDVERERAGFELAEGQARILREAACNPPFP